MQVVKHCAPDCSHSAKPWFVDLNSENTQRPYHIIRQVCAHQVPARESKLLHCHDPGSSGLVLQNNPQEHQLVILRRIRPDPDLGCVFRNQYRFHRVLPSQLSQKIVQRDRGEIVTIPDVETLRFQSEQAERHALVAGADPPSAPEGE